MIEKNGELIDAVNGVPLGVYRREPLEITLPLVEKKEKIKYKGKIVERERRVYGEFCFAGDFHYGHKDFNDSMMHAYINFLRKHKNVQVGFMGDLLECAQLSRFVSEESINLDQQVEEFCADWRGLADRVKFSLWGNHEERTARDHGDTSLMRYLMLEIGAENVIVPLPQRGLHIVFKVGDMRYGCYVHHSKTNARVNRKLQLQRAGSQNVAALIVHGHTHELAFVPRTFFEEAIIDGVPVTLVKRQYMLATGCFLDYPGYAEAGGYPLTEVGAPIVRFYADDFGIDCYDLATSYHKYVEKASAGAASDIFVHEDGGLRYGSLMDVDSPVRVTSEILAKRGEAWRT